MNHFTVKELVPKEVYNKYGELSLRWINKGVPVVLNFIREFYNKPVNVNNAQFDGRTLRLPSNKDYKIMSDHNTGDAVDFDVEEVDSLKVQSDCLKNPSLNKVLLENGVRSIEDGTNGWTHLGFIDLEGWGLQKKSGIWIVPVPKN